MTRVEPAMGPTEAAPLCALLGAVLTQTDAAELAEMLDELAFGAWAEPPVRTLLEGMRQALPQDPEELEREYVRLFLNPFGALCPLWQSAYDDPPQLMGESHHSALSWYRQKGLQPRLGNQPADHAGYLLMFYARLLDSGEAPEELERFRKQHLDWAAGLLRAIRDQTRLEFYRQAAALGLHLLSSQSHHEPD